MVASDLTCTNALSPVVGNSSSRSTVFCVRPTAPVRRHPLVENRRSTSNSKSCQVSNRHKLTIATLWAASVAMASETSGNGSSLILRTR